jgi:dipeptidyl aminopeptidase/acylaminoacyl peptidase
MPRRTLQRTLLLWLALAFLAGTPAFAQDTGAKKPLKLEDYDRWRTVISTEISDNGRWMTYAYGHREGEDTLYVRDLDRGEDHTVPQGERPVFSDDSRWVAYSISDGVELLDLRSGTRKIWKGVGEFRFAEGSGHLALRKTAGEADASHSGTDLILRDLSSGTEMLLGSVGSFAFNPGGSLLGYTVDAHEQVGNGIYAVHLASNSIEALDNDELRYDRLTWDRSGSALAGLKGATPEGSTERANSLVAFRNLGKGEVDRFLFDPNQKGGVPEGMVISEKGALTWQDDGSLVFVGIDEQGSVAEDDPDDPRPNVDIFHWRDDRIQSLQRAQAQRDRQFTFLSAVSLASDRFISLADSAMRTVTLSRDGRLGVGRDDRAYISDWEESRADYFLVDPEAGERKLILEGQKRTLGLSPDGGNFAYWKDGHVWIHDLESGTDRSLTASAPVSFVNEQYDHPGTKPPYGLAGWTADGEAMVLNHQYDLWLQPLDGSPAVNLTGGVGARDEIRFRYVRTDSEEVALDLKRPVLLSAYGEWTKKSGYFELDGDRLTEKVFEDRRFADLRKAKDTDRVMFTASTFSESPDYWVSDLGFDDPQRVTGANPQQAEYRWGRRILIDFENKDGVRLQATLAIPEGYEPGQRLPMIVNFYEKKSQDLHAYYAPIFGSSYPAGNMGPVAEFSAFVSNGYLVLQPDIHLNTGTTHSDMLDCVTAATQKVIDMGYADPGRIALGGGSFSGGGSAFIATQTDMFAAIVARAAPINLAGEFNILFSGSGENNHSYDIYGQGRYGTNPFDDPDLYRAQSPITHVKNMNTPLLYLHGVQDGSVEYLQGMEFYNALRFLGKPIIFLSYPDEGHNLRRYENQIDFTKRLWQFLDHYLKGAPAPDWMVDGVPFLRKGGDQGP